jgi:hypothetical protein
MPLENLRLDRELQWVKRSGRAERIVIPYQSSPSTSYKPSPKLKVPDTSAYTSNRTAFVEDVFENETVDGDPVLSR